MRAVSRSICRALAGSLVAASVAVVAPHAASASADAVSGGVGVAAAITDPGEPGGHPVVTSDYRLKPVSIAGLGARVEMIGHVVGPADATDQSPLVVFMHGQHAPCYDPTTAKLLERAPWPCPSGERAVPSHLGYDYVQRLLASQGFVTVSVAANGVNAQDFETLDAGAAARERLFARHLQRWVGWVGTGHYSADLDNVVLVAQGAAGEGADGLAISTRAADDFSISGLVLVAPTDTGFRSAAHTPTATLLPYCDGLLPELPGQAVTDVARDVSPTPALHASALVLGANHNYFNTEWTPGPATAPAFDDWFGGPRATCGSKNPGRLTAAQQRAVGKAYIAGPVRAFTGVDTAALAMLDGSEPAIPSIGSATVYTHAVGGGREVRRPGIDASAGNGVTECAGVSGFDAAPDACGASVDTARAPHWPATSAMSVPRHDALEFDWGSAGDTGVIDFATPLDLSSADSLDLRTIVDPDVGDVAVNVRLRDGTSNVAVTPRHGGALDALPTGGFVLGKLWAQTLRVPLAGVSGVDLSHITGVTVVATGTGPGHVWVLDLAGVPPAVSAPPAAPLPSVSITSVRQAEGDGPGPGQLLVHFTVQGSVTSPASFAVAPTFVLNDPVPEQVVALAPGQTDGDIAFPYQPNTRDGFNYSWPVRIYPRSGVMTSAYTATATVVDDDAPPTLTAKRLQASVREGDPARYRLTVSQRSDYPFVVTMRPARGPRSMTPATVGDFTPRLRHKWFGAKVPPLTRPLFKTDAYLLVKVSPRTSGTVVSLPTLRNPGQEPRKAITMTFTPPRGGGPVTVTVTLRDS